MRDARASQSLAAALRHLYRAMRSTARATRLGEETPAIPRGGEVTWHEVEDAVRVASDTLVSYLEQHPDDPADYHPAPSDDEWEGER